MGQGCTGELTHARCGFKAQLARPKRHSVWDKCCSSLGPPSPCKYKSPVQPLPWPRQSINYNPSRGTVTRQNRNSASTEQLLYDNSSFVCSVCGLAAPKEGGSASRSWLRKRVVGAWSRPARISESVRGPIQVFKAANIKAGGICCSFISISSPCPPWPSMVSDNPAAQWHPSPPYLQPSHSVPAASPFVGGRL